MDLLFIILILILWRLDHVKAKYKLGKALKQNFANACRHRTKYLGEVQKHQDLINFHTKYADSLILGSKDIRFLQQFDDPRKVRDYYNNALAEMNYLANKEISVTGQSDQGDQIDQAEK